MSCFLEHRGGRLLNQSTGLCEVPHCPQQALPRPPHSLLCEQTVPAHLSLQGRERKMGLAPAQVGVYCTWAGRRKELGRRWRRQFRVRVRFYILKWSWWHDYIQRPKFTMLYTSMSSCINNTLRHCIKGGGHFFVTYMQKDQRILFPTKDYCAIWVRRMHEAEIPFLLSHLWKKKKETATGIWIFPALISAENWVTSKTKRV